MTRDLDDLDDFDIDNLDLADIDNDNDNDYDYDSNNDLSPLPTTSTLTQVHFPEAIARRGDSDFAWPVVAGSPLGLQVAYSPFELDAASNNINRHPSRHPQSKNSPRLS